MLPPGSVATLTAHVLPQASLYLVELRLPSSSGTECWWGAAVKQLAHIYPRWWYLRNHLSNSSAMCCLGFAKSHHNPERLSHLWGLPEAATLCWRSGPCKWRGRPEDPRGLREKGDLKISGKAPFPLLRVSKRCGWPCGLIVFQVSLVVGFFSPSFLI